jgi:hypothetical protein
VIKSTEMEWNGMEWNGMKLKKNLVKDCDNEVIEELKNEGMRKEGK